MVVLHIAEAVGATAFIVCCVLWFIGGLDLE